VTTTSQDSVSQKALASYRTLNLALDWVRNSKESEISSNDRLIKNLRTGIYQVHRLATSAQAKMCVGVYGPSQAGKSYLVSALARKAGERLIAVFGNQEVDFIETINPEGGKEATGLVTRFTTDAINSPIGYPIQLKLLSELDLTKLFVNSYVNDILQDEDDEIEKHQSQVEEVLNELETMPKATSSISVEDVYELEDYCNSKFSSNFRIQALKKMGFWARAATLLPNLGNSGRLRLFKLLWEELPSYSQLYSNLVEDLSKLEFAPTVFSSTEALFNKENRTLVRSQTSIINVATLDGLINKNANSLRVATSDGKVFSIGLPTLCALTSELVVPIKNNPHEFFKSADLLDFPGARSRKGHPKGDKSLIQPQVQIENFLRGKVAYLFDKYSADLELTSMLLCIGPSNQEVVGLDAMVEDWIIKSHGGKPEARAKLTTSLFLVLSKFDQEFDEGAGKKLDGTRWSTRLQASLINSFGAHAHRTNWVHKWTNQSSFKNTFWLRNPNADQSGLIEYEGTPGSSKELDYSARKKPVIDTLKASFLSNPIVQNHFENPNTAWTEGMRLNDGGASYLLQKLAETCSPDLKLRQIDERLTRIIENLESELRKYYVSSDLETLQLEKFKTAQSITTSFAKLLKNQRLGEFVTTFLESDIDTVDTYKRLLLDFERKKHAKKGFDKSAQKDNLQIDPRDAEELGLVLTDSFESAEETSKRPHWSFSQSFIHQFIHEWRNRCLIKLSSENLSEYLLIERDHVLQLLNELEIAANRTGLVEELVEYVEKNQQYKSDDRRSWIWRQTSVVTAKFNDFIACGGLIVKENESINITNLSGKEIIIFHDKIEPVKNPEITDIQEDFSRRYLLDWIQAIQYSIRTNAVYQAGIRSDISSNLSLGSILKDLAQLLELGKNIHAS
jgi:hypothetical protein